MADFKYPYTSISIPPSAPYPQGQLLYRPLLIATLTASNGAGLRCIVLLDTGADACLFPLALAIALRIDVLSLPRTMTGGVGTSVNVTYYDKLKVDLGNGIAFTASVGFTEGLNVHGFGLLGHEGFFSAYEVHFSHPQKMFTILTP